MTSSSSKTMDGNRPQWSSSEVACLLCGKPGTVFSSRFFDFAAVLCTWHREHSIVFITPWYDGYDIEIDVGGEFVVDIGYFDILSVEPIVIDLFYVPDDDDRERVWSQLVQR